MSSYHRLGRVPPKRHTQFARAEGGLYYEEVFGARGFSGPYSTLYHCHLPTAALRVARLEGGPPEEWPVPEHRQHHLRSLPGPSSGDAIAVRTPLLFNDDIVISAAWPDRGMDAFYRNGEADEAYFIHEGSGELRTAFGVLEFGEGDYVVIPRGVTYQMTLEHGTGRFLLLEGAGAIETPARYRNEVGQLLEHAPYANRDLRLPSRLETHEKEGEHQVLVRTRQGLTAYWYRAHPFDVVGWDGYLYPWALNVHTIDPIVGRVHQPPPVHQTFQGPNFVVCTFLPRKLDYHPSAIPAPYNHSNVDSDEVLYYVNNQFTSRRGVGMGSITLHRRGLPHGPQPGAMEASIGKTETHEVAVMVDAFRPLRLTRLAERLDDPDYPYSWSRTP